MLLHNWINITGVVNYIITADDPLLVHLFGLAYDKGLIHGPHYWPILRKERPCDFIMKGQPQYCFNMMTSSNGNMFRVTGPLCGEFTGDRWIPRTKASDAELWCSLWSAHWINGWVNNREAGDLRRHRNHYDVNVMNGYIIEECCVLQWNMQASNMTESSWKTHKYKS